MYTVNCAVCGRGFHIIIARKTTNGVTHTKWQEHTASCRMVTWSGGFRKQLDLHPTDLPNPSSPLDVLKPPPPPSPSIPWPAGHPSTLRPTTSTPINNLIQAEIYLRFSSHFSHLSCRQNATKKKLLAPVCHWILSGCLRNRSRAFIVLLVFEVRKLIMVLREWMLSCDLPAPLPLPVWNVCL